MFTCYIWFLFVVVLGLLMPRSEVAVHTDSVHWQLPPPNERCVSKGNMETHGKQNIASRG